MVQYNDSMIYRITYIYIHIIHHNHHSIIMIKNHIVVSRGYFFELHNSISGSVTMDNIKSPQENMMTELVLKQRIVTAFGTFGLQIWLKRKPRKMKWV